MKKIYKEPTMTVVMLQITNHLMDLSPGNSASINSERVSDGNAFTKDEGDWDDDLWDE